MVIRKTYCGIATPAEECDTRGGKENTKNVTLWKVAVTHERVKAGNVRMEMELERGPISILKKIRFIFAKASEARAREKLRYCIRDSEAQLSRDPIEDVSNGDTEITTMCVSKKGKLPERKWGGYVLTYVTGGEIEISAKVEQGPAYEGEVVFDTGDVMKVFQS